MSLSTKVLKEMQSTVQIVLWTVGIYLVGIVILAVVDVPTPILVLISVFWFFLLWCWIWIRYHNFMDWWRDFWHDG